MAAPGSLSAAATLLVAVIRQLSELEPSRLRRCARPECSLVFTTSPAPQRSAGTPNAPVGYESGNDVTEPCKDRNEEAS